MHPRCCRRCCAAPAPHPACKRPLQQLQHSLRQPGKLLPPPDPAAGQAAASPRWPPAGVAAAAVQTPLRPAGGCARRRGRLAACRLQGRAGLAAEGVLAHGREHMRLTCCLHAAEAATPAGPPSRRIHEAQPPTNSARSRCSSRCGSGSPAAAAAAAAVAAARPLTVPAQSAAAAAASAHTAGEASRRSSARSSCPRRPPPASAERCLYTSGSSGNSSARRSQAETCTTAGLAAVPL